MYIVYRSRRRETRTRKDRINQRNEGFERQISGMVDEYMLWQKNLDEKGMSEAPTSSGSEGVEGTMHLHVIDVFREYLKSMLFPCSNPHYQRHIHSKSSSAPLIRGFQLPFCVTASYLALLSRQP